MAPEADPELSFTSFPTSWHVQSSGHPAESESALLALPSKLFKAFFNSASADEGRDQLQRRSPNSSQHSESNSSQGSQQRKAEEAAAAATGVPFPRANSSGQRRLPDVPEDGEADGAKFPTRPARHTRLSVLGRTGPSIGLSASNATALHDDLAGSSASLHTSKGPGDTGSIFRGSQGGFDPMASLSRASVRPHLADDNRSVASFSTSTYRGHKANNSDALENIVQVVRKMRGAGITQDYWLPDESTTQCFDCQLPFTAFRRKHHCTYVMCARMRIC